MKLMEHNYVEQLEEAFVAHSDNEKALAMSKYMQGLFPFYGINSTLRRSIEKTWFKELSLSDDLAFWELIKELWAKDQREFQYAALDLLVKRPKKHIQKEDHVHLEWLITNKSWWDTVDLLASHCVGNFYRKYPSEGSDVIADWNQSNHLWLERSCLIFQLKFGKETDVALLTNLIRQYSHKKEFFIQKAIGWSLRQLSKSNPEEVKNILNEIPLKGVALREATKYL